jgi:hypothetical protein
LGMGGLLHRTGIAACASSIGQSGVAKPSGRTSYWGDRTLIERCVWIFATAATKRTPSSRSGAPAAAVAEMRSWPCDGFTLK